MTAPARPVLSIVVPLYNEAGNVATLLERLGALTQRLQADIDCEIVLVNDGSSDATAAIVRDQMTRRSNIVLVNLSRNFGHQLAATAGLEIASGDAIVLM